MRSRKIALTILVLILLGIVAVSSTVSSTNTDSKIDPVLWSRMKETGEPQDALIFLTGAVDLDSLAPAPVLRADPPSTEEDIRNARCYIIKQIRKASIDLLDKSATRVIAVLKQAGVEYTCYYINNMCYAKAVPEEVLVQIDENPEVERITPDEKIDIPEIPNKTPALDGQNLCNPEGINLRDIQWSVKQIRAPELWKIGIDGTGIVIGIIDSGINPDHEAVKGRLRSSRSWYAPVNKYPCPYDSDTQYAHGTAGAGCAAGEKGIGVAPGAEVIACQLFGPNKSGGSTSVVTGCLEWNLCPTDPDGESNRDCCTAPDVVNMSWGIIGDKEKKGPLRRALDPIFEKFHRARIIPVAAIGNNGDVPPYCETTAYPATSKYVISVGATKSDRYFAEFTSCGPDEFGKIKPHISAPGNNVATCSVIGKPEIDKQCYALVNGTSFACPYVAGAIGLILDYDYALNFTEILEFLIKGAYRSPTYDAKTKPVPYCKDELFSKDIFPNNIYGYGEVDLEKTRKFVDEKYPLVGPRP